MGSRGQALLNMVYFSHLIKNKKKIQTLVNLKKEWAEQFLKWLIMLTSQMTFVEEAKKLMKIAV